MASIVANNVQASKPVGHSDECQAGDAGFSYAGIRRLGQDLDLGGLSIKSLRDDGCA